MTSDKLGADRQQLSPARHAESEISDTETLEAVVAMPGYDPVAQFFHWTTAVLILLLLIPLGLYAVWIGDGPTRSYLLDGWHKPLGLLVIALTICRLAWKGTRPAVVEAKGLHRWELITAKLVHWLLYGILLVMPLSGLLMSQGAGRPTSFFGLFSIPQMLPLDPALKPREQVAYHIGKLIHGSILPWVIYAIVALHIAGALKHRFIDGDKTYMRRMASFRRPTGRA